MSELELISACLKNDKNARRQLYESYYGKVSAIALRYSKNVEQSNDIVQKGFAFLFSNIGKYKAEKQKLSEWITEEFVLFTIQFIRSIRSEYYVASTVRVNENVEKSYDLFTDNIVTDFKNVEFEVLVKSLHQLVPSQRLVFNLHVVEEYDLPRISEILEASEQTVRSNLEKARYNLQKNIDKNIKSQKNEQPV